MTQPPRRAALALIAAISAGAAAPATPPATEAELAGNRLGLLQYCLGRKLMRADVVAAQQRLAVPGTPSIAQGRAGMVLTSDGRMTPIQDFANATGITISELCRQTGLSVVALPRGYVQP